MGYAHVIALFLLAVGHAGVWGASIAEARQESWMAGALNAPEHCRYSCGGESMSLADLPGKYECWGLFKMWCGAPPSGEGANRTEEVSGSVCQGHYLSVMYSMDSEPGVNHAVIVCEGGQSWVNLRTATCPHSGKRYKKMMGIVGAGTSINGMSFPSRDGGMRPVAGGGEAAAAPLLREMEASSALQAVRAQLQDNQSPVSDGDGLFKLESRSYKYSLSWKATKEVAPGEHTAAMAGWEDLEQEANAVLGQTWRDWLPGGAPSSPKSSGDERPVLLCNQKPAWWHGAAPCWGNFSVSASHSESAKPCTGKPASGSHSRALRAGMGSGVLQLGAAKHQHMTSSAAAAAGLTGSRSFRMTAECDGLWTGLLSSCWGITTAHAEVMEGDQLQMDKRTICSGRQSLRVIRQPGTRGMVTECRGEAVTALRAAIQPRPEAITK